VNITIEKNIYKVIFLMYNKITIFKEKIKMSRYTVVLSEKIIPDSNVETGGGTERTKEIQAVLDTAVEKGGLHLIVDGAYLTETLTVYSHTTIECVNSACGFFLKDGVTASLFKNAHCNISGERLDKDIRLIGGTYNLNCMKQEHHRDFCKWCEENNLDSFWGNTGFRFFGIEGLYVRDVIIKDQRTFAFACGNVYYLNMENVRIELPNMMYAQNQDGIHIFGESRFITLKNIVGMAGDDFIALAPDELDGVSSISDVLIDGVQLNGSDQVIRLLTHGKGKLDRVIIRNVTGTYTSYGFFINPWISPHYKSDERFGNFGSITIENVDLRQEGKKYDYTKPMLFRLGGIIDTLRLRNVRFVNAGDDSDFMQVGANYVLFEDETSDCLTQIKNLLLQNIEIISENGINTQGIVVKESNIERLCIDGIKAL